MVRPRPFRWHEFKNRYFSELDGKPDVVKQFFELSAKGRVTLLFSARDTARNQAVALKEYLAARSGQG
jgi:uncharacterized protein YeaO (DUF488 family)